MPKVSILTPIYNTNILHLKEMIESILGQTFKDFEFLILNDSPENKTIKEFVLSYNDSRIKYLENEKNLGISKSRNRLIEEACGEYLAIFDHDDVSLPRRLEVETNYLDKNPEIGVVSSNYKILGKMTTSHYPENNVDIKINLVTRGCVVLHTGSMIRKSVLINNNIRYKQEFSPCEDFMLWCDLLDKTMFHNIKEPLVYYRNHLGNTTHNNKEKMIDRESLIKNIMQAKYPYFSNCSSYQSSINLFGFIPLIQKVSIGNKVKYTFLKKFPLIKIVQ